MHIGRDKPPWEGEICKERKKERDYTQARVLRKI